MSSFNSDELGQRYRRLFYYKGAMSPLNQNELWEKFPELQGYHIVYHYNGIKEDDKRCER